MYQLTDRRLINDKTNKRFAPSVPAMGPNRSATGKQVVRNSLPAIPRLQIERKNESILSFHLKNSLDLKSDKALVAHYSNADHFNHTVFIF